jgi:hypothetical protein
MSSPSKTKAVVLISLLVLVSVGAGFFLGVIVAAAVNKKKEDPKFWRAAALKQLAKLHPTDAQNKLFEQQVGSAVEDLSQLRKQAATEAWQIVEKTVAKIDQELTPEQRETFAKIKPKDKPKEAR